MNYLFTKINNKHYLISMQDEPINSYCVKINDTKKYLRLYSSTDSNALTVCYKNNNSTYRFGYTQLGIVIKRRKYGYTDFDEYISSEIEQLYDCIKYISKLGIFAYADAYIGKEGITGNVYKYTRLGWSYDGKNFTHLTLDNSKNIFNQIYINSGAAIYPKFILYKNSDTIILYCDCMYYTGNDTWYFGVFYKVTNFKSSSPTFNVYKVWGTTPDTSGYTVKFIAENDTYAYYTVGKDIYALNKDSMTMTKLATLSLYNTSVFADKKNGIIETSDGYRINMNTCAVSTISSSIYFGSAYIDSEDYKRTLRTVGVIGEYYVIEAVNKSCYNGGENYYFLTKVPSDITAKSTLSTTAKSKMPGIPVLYNPLKDGYYFLRNTFESSYGKGDSKRYFYFFPKYHSPNPNQEQIIEHNGLKISGDNFSAWSIKSIASVFGNFTINESADYTFSYYE